MLSPAREDGLAVVDRQRLWDLWNLRTLFPRWGTLELERLLRTGEEFDAREHRLFAEPRVAAQRLGQQADQVFRDHPDLASGLTISLHLGPYSLAPVPWLAAGHQVYILINQASLRGIKPIYDALYQTLGLPGAVVWVPIEGVGFAMALWRALRRQRPVFAFLDGNDGLGGAGETLAHGIIHPLPGRDIRVRTGLARLALRLGCPVHSLVTVWNDTEGFRWVRGPTWQWAPGTSFTAATGDLFGWAFDVIRRYPAQWRAWNMLTAVYESFRDDAAAPGSAGGDPRRVARLDQRCLLLQWRRPVVMWPGAMLEDVEGACFYDAGGMSASDLAFLQKQEVFTPQEVAVWLGAGWVADHLVRLVALNFVAPVDQK